MPRAAITFLSIFPVAVLAASFAGCMLSPLPLWLTLNSSTVPFAVVTEKVALWPPSDTVTGAAGTVTGAAAVPCVRDTDPLPVLTAKLPSVFVPSSDAV